jgi:CHAT domain
MNQKSILFLSANPKGTEKLQLEEEKQDIINRLRESGYSENPIFSIESTQSNEIQQAFIKYKPHIVHFSGHGAGEKGLVFEDVDGNVKLVESAALANLFKLFSNRIECVILNTCDSEFQAQEIVKYIDYVIGMSSEIREPDAINFALGFYTAIGDGQSYEFAYELGCNSIHIEGSQEYYIPQIFKELNSGKEDDGIKVGVTFKDNGEDEDEDLKEYIQLEEDSSSSRKSKKKLKDRAAHGYFIIAIAIIIFILLLIIYGCNATYLSSTWYPILIVIPLSFFTYKVKPYAEDIHLHKNIPEKYGDICYIRQGIFIKNYSKDYYLICNLTASCIYPHCSDKSGGKIVVVKAPHKEIEKGRKLVCLCSTCGEEHSYRVDLNWVATKDNTIDWSKPTQVKK